MIKFVFCFSREAKKQTVEIQHWVGVGLVRHSLLNCSPVLLHVSWSQENGSKVLWVVQWGFCGVGSWTDETLELVSALNLGEREDRWIWNFTSLSGALCLWRELTCCYLLEYKVAKYTTSISFSTPLLAEPWTFLISLGYPGVWLAAAPLRKWA